MNRFSLIGFGVALIILMFGLCWAKEDGSTPSQLGRVVINIPSRTLWLFEDGELVKQYSVGLGRPGYMTPMGKYSVLKKIANPMWENPYLPPKANRAAPMGKNNPLGTRWMSFK